MALIYAINCLENNKKYIGSTLDLDFAKERHFKNLKNNKGNVLIQSDYNKYGKEKFTIEIIEDGLNDDNYLIERENYWMDYYKTYAPKFGIDFGYNLQRATRIKHNEESRKKISESLKGNKNNTGGWKMPVETIEKFKGNKNAIKFDLETALLIKHDILNDRRKIALRPKLNSIGKRYNVSEPTLINIYYGKHHFSKELGGGYKEWTGN